MLQYIGFNDSRRFGVCVDPPGRTELDCGTALCHDEHFEHSLVPTCARLAAGAYEALKGPDIAQSFR